jgi:aryl-alcohol dehydrogenase-like predicted oxidoreductase
MTGSNIMTDARPRKRILGDTDLSVSPVGLGCMGMSEFYGPAMDERAAVALLQEAVERGVNHFDTAEMYGIGHNETLVGRALRDRREGLVIATKFGPLRDPKTGERLGVDGSPANVRRASRGSLERLGLEIIDVYYLHRMDPDTPIEDTVGEMKKLVEEGRVRALGLSEASAETIRRAHAVHPITALQTEYSLFSRHVEKEILPTCRELGISLVAYSPLGRGLLGGEFTGENRPTGEGEFRRGEAQPRFREGNYEANLELVETVKTVARRRGVSPAQVALAWVLRQGEGIVTIPGTTNPAHLESNVAALEVELAEEDLGLLESLSSRVRGARYNEAGMRAVEE